jgi:two-component system, NarL family, nitrate/nitrite response regulator NarL
MRGRDVRILVVDDHAAVRKVLIRLLQDSSLLVVGEAVDGQEAVEKCEHLRPDIVLLDISMPLLNGFEAAREIARLCPTVKVIFLSGHASQGYAQEAIRAGGAGFVSKDHAAFTLIEAIEAALAGKTYINGSSAA